jgi:hypothetical protein
MLVECQRHGPNAGVLVSPDLQQAVAAGRRVSKVREIVYNYDGEPYMRIVVSMSFATEHNVGESHDLDLPDQYPPWHEALLVVCEKCLDQAIAA